MIASAVQRTRRMRFGNYVNALPFHHPLRLAAEAAMLDNLAQGRFDFGVGKGVRPGEFAKLGINFEDGVAMTEEAIEILLQGVDRRAASPHRPVLELSRAEPAAHASIQRPHPPLHEVASRPASVGARWGAGLASGDAFHADGGRGALR